MLFSVADYYCMFQLICKDIPVVLIQESALCGCNPSVDIPPTYKLGDFLVSLSARFVYTEWMSMIESIYSNEGRNLSMPITKLAMHFEELDQSMPIKMIRPSLSILKNIIFTLSSESSDNTVSMDRLMINLVQHQGIRNEIFSIKPTRNTTDTTRDLKY